MQLNSRDSFTDCPTREQQARVGDSVVHQKVHLATNTDWRLAWHYLTLSGSPRIYTAIWARGLREFAEMAAWLGENTSREWAERLYKKANISS